MQWGARLRSVIGNIHVRRDVNAFLGLDQRALLPAPPAPTVFEPRSDGNWGAAAHGLRTTSLDAQPSQLTASYDEHAWPSRARFQTRHQSDGLHRCS